MTVLKQVDVESMTWVRCRWASPPALYAVCADKEKAVAALPWRGGVLATFSVELRMANRHVRRDERRENAMVMTKRCLRSPDSIRSLVSSLALFRNQL
jgi:hypothetical protein